MYNYEKHLIAHYLREKLNENYGNCYGYRALIHLLLTIKNDDINNDLAINNSNQIKIDHSARASISTYGLNTLANFSLNNVNDSVRVSYTLNRNNRNPIERELIFHVIPEQLDYHPVLVERGLNSYLEERQTLFSQIRGVSSPVIDEVDGKIVALHCFLSALLSVPELVRQISNNVNPIYQERFLQTILGAALFYCPRRRDTHWDRRISLAALRGKVVNNKHWTTDHINPRRKGAMDLMNAFRGNIMSVDDLNEFYHNQLAPFTYLDSHENRRLINYFLEHDNYENALHANGIEMIPANEERFIDNAELNRFVRYMQENYNDNIAFTSRYVNSMLIVFRNR